MFLPQVLDFLGIQLDYPLLVPERRDEVGIASFDRPLSRLFYAILKAVATLQII